uniref:RNB domain-containing protein n=1 Tax=Vannella robusta TaxID=1487602 RepID=A0A7S4HTI3_9EUKA
MDVKGKASESDGKFVYVRILYWPMYARYPICEIARIEGDIDKFDTQYSALKVKNNVTHADTFDDSLLVGLPLSGWQIPEDEIERRVDLRNELIFSIDPPTAKDLDDALSCVRLPNGNFRVGVHIADVSYFVAQDSPLDLEARERGNTVYFVTENIPMLPRILCDELCSLKGNVDRLAFSVIWELTPTGEKVSEEFVRSIICTKGQLDYATAHDMIKNPDAYADDPEMLQCATAIIDLNNIATELRKFRYENGSISLDNAEIHFDFDEEGNITGVSPYERYDSHFLVEEFMLLANISVAEKIFKSMPDGGAMLRWHPKPDPSKLSDFQKQCDSLGLKVDCTNSQTLHESIQQIHKEFNGITMDAILYLASQPMQSALYTASSPDAVENAYHHYALNFPLYTHFTSPIRRYPDLIVHRQLGHIIADEPQTMKCDDVRAISTNCNQRKREADNASRDCSRLYLNQYLRTRRFIESGIVVEVTKSTATILVPDYDIRCQISLVDTEKYSIKYMKASKTLEVAFKDSDTDRKDWPIVALKLLQTVDVELLYTSQNFCQTISLQLAKPGERETLKNKNDVQKT